MLSFSLKDWQLQKVARTAARDHQELVINALPLFCETNPKS